MSGGSLGGVGGSLNNGHGGSLGGTVNDNILSNLHPHLQTLTGGSGGSFSGVSGGGAMGRGMSGLLAGNNNNNNNSNNNMHLDNNR